MSRRIRLRVAYDGTDFSGFQALPERRTVQGTLQDALSKHCGELVHVYGAGRTDAGVHAQGQVVHFDTVSRTPPERYREALGRHLPRDVSILRSEAVSEAFHARFSATSRVYRYAIVPGPRSPLMGRFAWQPQETPDWTVLIARAAQLVGERDFRCFRITGDDGSTVRRLARCEVRRVGPGGVITLEANAFLRGMVRWIVAALWACATRRMEEEEFERMMEGVSRPQTLVPAPPQGLCLVRVRYRIESG